jgi:hypothetical protein
MNHTFETNGSVVTFVEHNGVVSITAEKCGMKFDVGQIVDTESKNPLIYFSNFVGMNLVGEIIHQWSILKGGHRHNDDSDWENEWMNAPMGKVE